MDYGLMNGHAMGIVMKEMVRRAIVEIRNQRMVFETQQKENKYKDGEDFVTTADRAAQKIYLRTIRECFPEFGIMGEEDELLVPCTLDNNTHLYFTIDPLDGTKAFMRRQSHGVGTMLGLVQDGEVIAACVGDIMTQEIYYFRPGSSNVHRLSEYDNAETLVINPNLRLKSQYVLLRDDPQKHSACAQGIVKNSFKNLEVAGGSIGIGFARLWKGEVGAMILLPGAETPWDITPVVGISKKLGFKFFDMTDPEEGHFMESTPPIVMHVHHRKFETLVIHESRVEEFASRQDL